MVLLAVFKTGGVFVPLDIDAPMERLALILSEVQPAAILTSDALRHRLPESQQARAIGLDTLRAEINGQPAGELKTQIDEKQAAYIIYTSGSTGQPKGVVNLYGALDAACAAWGRMYQLDELKPCLLQQAHVAFDVFIEDCVRSLCFGGRLVICPRQIQLVPSLLYQMMQQKAITVSEFVPAVLRQLVRYLEETGQSLAQLELLIIGAEGWPGAERRKIRRVLVLQRDFLW
jgi:non-ribosomal peptide synthetase component F